MTIWKYLLDIADIQIINLPGHSKPLSVQVQNGELCLWALVEETMPLRWSWRVRIVGTGHPFPDYLTCQFLGTVQMGPLVWHVFVERL